LVDITIGAPALKIFLKPYLWVGGSLFVRYAAFLVLSVTSTTDTGQALALDRMNYH